MPKHSSVLAPTSCEAPLPPEPQVARLHTPAAHSQAEVALWQQAARRSRLREHAGGLLLTGYVVLCAVPALFGVYAIVRSLTIAH